MEYTEEQVRGFKEEFAKRRRLHLVLVTILVIFALAVSVFAQGWSESNQAIWLAAFFVFVVIVVVFAIRNNRCPACGGLIGNSWRVRYCPLCGVPLK